MLSHLKHPAVIQAIASPFILFGLFLFATALVALLATDNLIRALTDPSPAAYAPLRAKKRA